MRAGSLYLLALLTFLSTPSLGADEAAPQDSANDGISTITVTATRIDRELDQVPASASVVSGVAVQLARQQLGLDEALAEVPGVYMQNRFNFAQDLRISIRGYGARSSFGVRGIKVFVDDLPETLADGQSQVDGIDLSSVERVEVLRGASSAMYGNASGGVISIQSEQGSPEPFLEARLAVGEFGYQKHQLKTGGGSDKFDYLLSVSDLAIDGYRDHSKAGNTQLNGRFRFRPNDRSLLSLSISATDQPVSEDAGGVTLQDATANPRAARDRNVQFNAGEALDQQKLGLSYRHDLDGGATLRARTYVLQREFLGRLPFAGGGVVAFDRAFSGAGVSYSRPFSTGKIEHRLIAGIDYDRQDDDRQRFDNDMGLVGQLTLEQNELITSTGWFLQDEMQLTERLTGTVGIRYDSIDFDVTDTFTVDGDDSGARTLSDVSPSIGFVFVAREDLRFYGNASTAFETPTSTEFADPAGGGGFNTSLEPQQSTSIEFGIRGQLLRGGRYEVAVFNIEIDDELIPFEIASSPGRDFFANAGKSNRRGVEFAVSADITRDVSGSLSYTYSRFTFDDFVDDNGNDYAGNITPGVPRHFAFANLSYVNDRGFFASLDARYSDEIVVNNANTAVVDGATVIDLRAGFRRTVGSVEFEPFVGINNVTDTSYTANARINAFGGRYYEPGPEMNVYGGLSIRYQP